MKTFRTKYTLTFVASGAVLLMLALLGLQPTTAQQGSPQGPPPGGQGGPPRGPGGPGRGPGIEALVVDDHTGFEAIFDGKSLKGWDGDPEAWRGENDAIVGQSTLRSPLKANTFLIYRGSQPGDFELKLDYRINSTNSGVQYRSAELPEVGRWVLKGYQADIDFDNRFTGQLYEERGRGFMAMRGQMTHITPGKKRVIANLRRCTSDRR